MANIDPKTDEEVRNILATIDPKTDDEVCNNTGYY